MGLTLIRLEKSEIKSGHGKPSPYKPARILLVRNSIGLLVIVAALLAGPVLSEAASGKSCRQMKKELAELRREYHEYATTAPGSPEKISFDRLAELLDKIIELKRAMKEVNCEPPPRSKDIKERK